ncbi:MAG TPA: hypothetical protein VJB13_03000 [Candidatus Nanoarchaeia archaeon]|nr:hypothetical protein [Candidatus Nanoarchaeia archaeon]
MATIDLFEVGKTKEVNGEADLDSLTQGDVVKVYFGHNYGEMMSKAQEMKYAGADGRTVLFNHQSSNDSGTLQLSKDLASYRDGILVHPQVIRYKK